jgi:predicted RND superfamily exporter protein
MGKLSTLVDSTAAKARMFGRVADLGAQAFAERNTRLYKWLAETGLAAKYDVHITGTGTLIDRTNQNLVSSLSKGLGVAFLLISLIMGFMFGSLSMVIIALIPNVLPLITVAAVMTLTGIDLKMSTSIIFTIAFGIAVDDTIHLLSRYKLELLKGRSRLMALRNSYVHTGKALVITSIILFGGFIGMCFSTFQSTYYIGLLVTLTLFFALLFDLTLLPALVAAFGGKKRTKAQG